jgi:hypothetical protein
MAPMARALGRFIFKFQRSGGDGWTKYTRAEPQNTVFLVAQERDQGVARGPGGPPYFGAETAWKLDVSYAAAGI